MKVAARFITTMAIAFVMAPCIYADDAVKPAASTARNDELVSAPVGFTEAESGVPSASLTSWASESGSQPARAGRSRRAEESEGYVPKFEWFLGYSFWRAMPTSQSNRMGYLHGGSTSFAYNFNRYLGLVADVGGYDNSKITLFSPTASETLNSNGTAYTFLFGPRVSFRKYERLTPFIQALFGGTHASSVTVSGCGSDPSCTPLPSENAFATMLGAGLDIKLSHHIALRLIEGDFLLTRFHDPFAASTDTRGWQKNVRLSSGLVFRFGGNPPPAPRAAMSASCSADKESVYAGSGDLVAVQVRADSMERYPVNYSWSASEGAVDGTGSEVRWNSAERRPGAYVLKVHVDNGRNGSADCAVNVRVELRPNRPPVISCSADRGRVTVGDAVTVTATASDPDNDQLTYGWNASGGRVDGSASSVTFQTAGLAPGSYKITGHVDDGRGGTAECAVNVAAEAAQVPAEVIALETRLALHSIYFATAKPTTENPTGGLVDSQQQIVLALAQDFDRYLTFKPQAHLILQGHADHRGTPEFNKELTERRVERTKNFLVEHGVPAGNIEMQAEGEEDNLNAEQVKALIRQNPDLTAQERQKIEGNLHAIVWANNRRVDVILSTTGQQSVRQYPFNAKDSLALLSTSGGEKAKRQQPATAKVKAAKL